MKYAWRRSVTLQRCWLVGNHFLAVPNVYDIFLIHAVLSQARNLDLPTIISVIILAMFQHI